MKVTKIDSKGIDLITLFEGFEAKPYLCSANVPTIGFGTTRYQNGHKVKLTDAPISRGTAIEHFKYDVAFFELQVDAMAVDTITQNQFNALVSFAYNLGAQSLKGSTLLKKVNANPNDPTIAVEFLKWVNAGGRKVAGLVRRREAEANLYFAK
jgi:lysozyme